VRIITVSDKVKKFFSEHLLPVHKITSVVPTEKGWDVEVEVIEEQEYMIASAKDEMIGVYNVSVNGDLEIVSFERAQLRRRGALD